MENPSSQLAIIPPQELMRQATDIAAVCREIVMASAVEIQGRKYVKVEGWMAIATTHGCIGSARDVRRVDGGYTAIGEIKRISDGAILCQAEGFVGEDEATWFGGKAMVWDKQSRQKVEKILPKRDEYAIRAMTQTRALSRACRSAFAHVVVMMNAGLSTTPAEEVPNGGFNDGDDNNDHAINQREERREQDARNVANEQRDTRDASAQHRQPEVTITEKTTIAGLKVEDVNIAEGTSKKGPWKKWGVKLSNGVTAGTFSETVSQSAITALASGATVTVSLEPNGKYVNLVDCIES
jgi:hypothetical protein